MLNMGMREHNHLKFSSVKGPAHGTAVTIAINSHGIPGEEQTNGSLLDMSKVFAEPLATMLQKNCKFLPWESSTATTTYVHNSQFFWSSRVARQNL